MAVDVVDSVVLDMVAGLAVPGCRRVPLENLHFTLKFLGNVNEEQLEDVRQKLKTVRFKRFQLELDHAGIFPSSRNPRVVWIAPGAGSTELASLANQVNVALVGAGFEQDGRKEPHVTVFRARRNCKPDIIKPDITNPVRMAVSEFALKQSVLDGKPTYTTLERYHGN